MNIAKTLFNKVCEQALLKDVIKLNGSEYLFLAQLDTAQKQFQRFLGHEAINSLYIQRYKDNLSQNLDYVSSRCIKYHHIVFPAKIPAFSNLFKEAGLNISPIFNENHKHPDVSYPLNLLSGERDFLLQDTHNNDHGKLILVNHLLERLGITPENLEPVWEKALILGDMGKRLGLKEAEEQKLRGFKNFHSRPRTFSNSEALPGNSGQIFLTLNEKALSNKRILLFGDSFIHSCIPILSYYFRDVIYFRSPFILRDIADNLRPDYIVTSNAERYLAAVPDALVNKPYFTHYFNESFAPQKMNGLNRAALNALFCGRNSHEYSAFRRSLMSDLS